MTNLSNVLKSRDINFADKGSVVLEKTLESPLDCKEIKPAHPKGNQSWIFIGRTDAEAETPILWPSDVKNWLTGKDSDTGKDWMQEEKGMTEDEMVGWHHWLSGHEFEQTPGVGDGQGGLVCCSPLELQRIRLNWVTELNWYHQAKIWTNKSGMPFHLIGYCEGQSKNRQVFWLSKGI